MSVRATSPEGVRLRLTGRAGVLLIVLTLLGAFATSPVRNYLSERGHISALQRQAQQLEDANAALQTEIARLRQPAEMERLARQCLGMVAAGETAFVLSSRSTTRMSGC